MKLLFKISSLILFIAWSLSAQAQSKIVIDDRTSVLTDEVENLLQKKFLEKNLYLTTSVDFKNKCDYYFASILKSDRTYFMEVENCDNELLGSVSAGSSLESASASEKAVIIFYNIIDLIENPAAPQSNDFKGDFKTEQYIHPDSMISEHDSRYFFAPTALPLKKSELYYNSLYFLLHDIQYGVTDRLTVGMGTTIIGLPVYFTAKYSIPLQDKSHFAIGNMLVAGTYGTNFLGNLAFGTYTYGDSHSNISIGAGHLYFDPGNSNSGRSSSIVGNLSGILRAGKYFYFLTENYLFNFQNTETADRITSLPDGTFIFQEGEFSVRRNIWYGLTGIRFVRKSNELVSWQLGLTHLLIVNSDIPSPYNSPDWNSFSYNAGSTFVTFPTISYTRKFKL
ncbi:hypothetical protein SAMN05661096_01885 [Marivirga sericea]|uniref:Uncharacterized protein n=1 Tax=Marivirga sericea TaxID=1028 RepID=A0A1X7JNW7_9BACT|nr:hypothetical protein [Marivirga sericea]SMG29655.1 hypothetical protein SAMN05661096_01885 [Marivirga sericea]